MRKSLNQTTTQRNQAATFITGKKFLLATALTLALLTGNAQQSDQQVTSRKHWLSLEIDPAPFILKGILSA